MYVCKLYKCNLLGLYMHICFQSWYIGSKQSFGVLFFGDGCLSYSQLYSVACSSLCRVEASWAFIHVVYWLGVSVNSLRFSYLGRTCGTQRQLHHQKLTTEAGEMDGSVHKVLARQAWGPEFNSQHPWEKAGMEVGTCLQSQSVLERQR